MFVEFLKQKPMAYADGREDYPTQMMIERCETFIAKPPADDWDFVYATHKEGLKLFYFSFDIFAQNSIFFSF